MENGPYIEQLQIIEKHKNRIDNKIQHESTMKY